MNFNKKKLFLIFLILATISALYFGYENNIYWHIKQKLSPDKLPVIDKSESFTVVVLPDTQYYSEKNPEIFCAQTDWIKKNINRLNIVSVSHMGDIVQNGGNIAEWKAAKDCMKTLDGVTPYTIIPGNHDTNKTSNKSSGFSNYNKYFPSDTYEKYKWYVDNHNENQNSAVLIKKLGVEILFINLEIEPSDEAIAWANRVANKYSNTYTIVTTHKYLPDDSSTLDEKTEFSDPGPNNNGAQIWRKLVSPNCQIRMVWNGHYHKTDGENRITTKNACGQDVVQILQDYQDRENGGNGLLRIYTFTPSKKNIKVSTYSPVLEEYEKDLSSEFTLDFLMLD